MIFKTFTILANDATKEPMFFGTSVNIARLNADILKNYVEFICNKRMRTIGLKGPYHQPSNPLPWTEHWISSKETQVAPQEEEITSYLIGTVENDASKDSFTGFKL